MVLGPSYNLRRFPVERARLLNPQRRRDDDNREDSSNALVRSWTRASIFIRRSAGTA